MIWIILKLTKLIYFMRSKVTLSKLKLGFFEILERDCRASQLALLASRFVFKAFRTFSGVKGSSFKRIPAAS